MSLYCALAGSNPPSLSPFLRELSASSGYSTSSINEPPTAQASSVEKYRKLSLTPNLPRLNDPLSASKVSYSEDSDLIEDSLDCFTSDNNLSVSKPPFLANNIHTSSSITDLTFTVPTNYIQQEPEKMNRIAAKIRAKRALTGQNSAPESTQRGPREQSSSSTPGNSPRDHPSPRDHTSPRDHSTSPHPSSPHPSSPHPSSAQDQESGESSRGDITPVMHRVTTTKLVDQALRKRGHKKSGEDEHEGQSGEEYSTAKKVSSPRKNTVVITHDSASSQAGSTTDDASLSKDSLDNGYTASPSISVLSDPLYDKSLSVNKPFKSSPSLGNTRSPESSRKLQRSASSNPTLRRATTPEQQPPSSETSEPDHSDSKPTDKRKMFAQRSGSKKKMREEFLLSPNVLAEIGERSDNSDQSFDYGVQDTASMINSQVIGCT